MPGITVDVWLYGALARYGGDAARGGYAHVELHLPPGSTLADLLAHLDMPTEERGITFINGQLSAMPGLQPDLGHILCAGDRVGCFDPKSMWPCQYRQGAALTDEMARVLNQDTGRGLHHSYDIQDEA